MSVIPTIAQSLPSGASPLIIAGVAFVMAVSLIAALLVLVLLTRSTIAGRHTPQLQPGRPESARRIARHWHLSGFLSDASYYRLYRMMEAGETAYPYWSGGESVGSPCIWANNRRYSLTEWNQESSTLARSPGQGMEEEQYRHE